jgi:hypothetical protein
VRRAQADPATGEVRVRVIAKLAGRCPARPERKHDGAITSFAGCGVPPILSHALRDVLELGWVFVDPHSPRRHASVAAPFWLGFGDAVTLLGVLRLGNRLRGGRGDETKREDAGDRGVDRGRLVHGGISVRLEEKTGRQPVWTVGRRAPPDLTRGGGAFRHVRAGALRRQLR